MAVNQTVLKFMKDGNRPYALNDIYEKFKADHGKTALQKALDTLVGQKKLLVKAYGKMNIYSVMHQNEKVDPEKVRKRMKFFLV